MKTPGKYQVATTEFHIHYKLHTFYAADKTNKEKGEKNNKETTKRKGI
jgi:hypothetical protein